MSIAKILCASCGERIEQAPICPICLGTAVLNHDYELIEEVGSGSFGTTFKARRISDGQFLAVKEMLLSKADTAKTLELFEREAKVLERLEHPGIPKYHDDFIIGFGRHTALYLVQDFVAGKTLDEVFDGPTKPSQVHQVCLNVLEILSYLHSFSPPVIHRDIKPQNIIQSDDGKLTLIDFGSVKAAMDRKEGGSTVAGTFGYMPPEQLMGRAVPQSDIYTVGALCVKLLTGQEPEAFLKKDRSFDFGAMSISAGAENVLSRLLDPEADKRPDSIEAIDLFDGLLKGGSPSALIRRESSGMTLYSFEAYTRILSQPGPREVPAWMVRTHTFVFSTLFLTSTSLAFAVFCSWMAWLHQLWLIAVIGAFFAIGLPVLMRFADRSKRELLRNGVLTQARVVSTQIQQRGQDAQFEILYDYDVFGRQFEGKWTDRLPDKIDVNDLTPSDTILALYSPSHPHDSLLLFAFPQRMGRNHARVCFRISVAGAILQEYPIEGWMSIGSAPDNTIMLPYSGVEPHHLLIIPNKVSNPFIIMTSTTHVRRVAGDLKINGEPAQEQKLTMGDVVEFAEIKMEVVPIKGET